jgi:hypothetical protein
MTAHAMTEQDPFWATHWTPPPADSITKKDLLTRAMGETFRPENLTDRQRAALLAQPSYVGISGRSSGGLRQIQGDR